MEKATREKLAKIAKDRALKTGNDMARQRQQDLLGTAVPPDLYVTDPEEEK